MEGTELYEWWKNGRYRPYDTDEAVELIARIKEITPPWIRIMRVHREFPVNLIIAGVKSGNVRELALNKLRLEGKRCRCIRCREVGHRALKEKLYVDPANLNMVRREYAASGGTEIFMAIEDPTQDVLVGYLRLRFPSNGTHRPEINPRTAIVRELHVYGPEVPIGLRNPDAWQHKGIGHELLGEAEDMAKEGGAHKLLILSARRPSLLWQVGIQT